MDIPPWELSRGGVFSINIMSRGPWALSPEPLQGLAGLGTPQESHPLCLGGHSVSRRPAGGGQSLCSDQTQGLREEGT